MVPETIMAGIAWLVTVEATAGAGEGTGSSQPTHSDVLPPARLHLRESPQSSLNSTTSWEPNVQIPELERVTASAKDPGSVPSTHSSRAPIPFLVFFDNWTHTSRGYTCRQKLHIDKRRLVHASYPGSQQG